MTAALTDLTFDQGIGSQIVIPNLKDLSGALLNLTSFAARMQMRQSVAAAALLTKDSSDGGILLSTTFSSDGTTVTANSITISVTDQDAAAFQPSAFAIAPLAPFSDAVPTYSMGLWECRVYSPSGQAYSVARGNVYLTLGIVQNDGSSGTPGSPTSPSGPAYAPASVSTGSTFVIPDSAQVVSAMPIQIDGTLQVDGFLIEV